ncbi:hypothetical protein KR51_00024780 [Rubidibacter lacunae KORDI 51-2]|uniref:FHA domain containing protein n=1 Tax=Rubidibacter lacunae KORDI 51-2 TaxID=582515 RepID=U5D8P1_9CHRO|nr:DUF6130 family protein [Rubidibacter lacunae]ERN40973.1 hypothetical protein KR51_00024780 [Rubidibacter lacunae KORDI 51-2]
MASWLASDWKRAAIVGSLLVLLVFGINGCSDRVEPDRAVDGEPTAPITRLVEVAPPPVIRELRQRLDAFRPQVTVLSPEDGAVLTDTTARVRVRVRDLPIFKDEQLGLGPHLHVILDNEPYRAVYTDDEPLVFENLAPGTHTVRIFASRPWHESFKNEGAYAQVTFHVLTPTAGNNPDPGLPLLTYSRPRGSYGAEPIMLDFFLTNAPIRLGVREANALGSDDWRVRVTVNGQSFLMDTWMPVYLEGFEVGRNWVKLEYLDAEANPVGNAFNTTARILEFQPEGQDTLAKLVRGELSLEESLGIVDPNYHLPAASEEIGVPEGLDVEGDEEPEAIAPPTSDSDVSAGPDASEVEESGAAAVEDSAAITPPDTEVPEAPEEIASPQSEAADTLDVGEPEAVEAIAPQQSEVPEPEVEVTPEPEANEAIAPPDPATVPLQEVDATGPEEIEAIAPDAEGDTDVDADIDAEADSEPTGVSLGD